MAKSWEMSRRGLKRKQLYRTGTHRCQVAVGRQHSGPVFVMTHNAVKHRLQKLMWPKMSV